MTDGSDATAGGAPRIEIHLAAAPQIDAFDAWHSSLSYLYDVGALRSERLAQFSGDVVGYHLGESIIFQNWSVAQSLSRDYLRIKRSGIDHIMLQMHVSGRLRGEFEGQAADVGPGDIVFIDFGRRVDFRFSKFETITLIVPRDRLPASLRHRNLHGVVLSRRSAATRLLGRHLKGLLQSADALVAAESAAAIEAAFALAIGALPGSDAASSHDRPWTGRTLLDEAHGYIDRHLGTRDLTPETIAAGLRMSRSTLYRLFEVHEGISGYILGRRLDGCFDAILNGRTRGASISEIAFAHGFNSEAHFSRAFRQRFGVSPRDVRALAGSDFRSFRDFPPGPTEIATTREWVGTLGRRTATEDRAARLGTLDQEI